MPFQCSQILTIKHRIAQLFIVAITPFAIMMISSVQILISVLLLVASFDPSRIFVQAKLGLRSRFRHHTTDTQVDMGPDAHPITDFQQNAHVLLMGLPEGTHLTQGQAHFFDESLRAAYNSFTTSPDLQVVQVKIVHQQESQGDGDRELWDARFRRFYDYSVFMTGRCGRMCSNHRHLRQLPNTRSSSSNVEDNLHPQQRRQQQEHAPMLPDVVDHSKFERAFLSMLQRGPYPIFHQVTDCHIAWN
jgi:hypothetical protein